MTHRIIENESLLDEIVSQYFTVTMSGQKGPQVGVSVTSRNILKNQHWNKEF